MSLLQWTRRNRRRGLHELSSFPPFALHAGDSLLVRGRVSLVVHTVDRLLTREQRDFYFAHGYVKVERFVAHVRVVTFKDVNVEETPKEP